MPLRVGSQVRMSKPQSPFEDPVFVDDRQGTVIAINSADDCDGYEIYNSVSVRWDDGEIEFCPRCCEESERTIEELVDVTPLLYANLYLYDRAYGGPQEGGWWYDTYTPYENGDAWTDPPPHGHFSSTEAAQSAYEALKKWAEEENAKRRSPSSVLSEGHFRVQLEAWPAEHYPTSRPHYC